MRSETLLTHLFNGVSVYSFGARPPPSPCMLVKYCMALPKMVLNLTLVLGEGSTNEHSFCKDMHL